MRIFLFFFISISSVYASEFYVSVTGNDLNTGGINDPLETIQKAQELASYGDTVFIRGGEYVMREDQIARIYDIWAYVTELTKDGINYFAYQDEKPIFDYSNIKPVNKRVIAFFISGNNIHIKGIDVKGVQVTITDVNTQSECFEIKGGDNNIIENVNMYDNMAIGVYILRGKNNLILNCDAYRNYDPISQNGGGVEGGNVDGFGLHVRSGDVGNTFRGCRAWLNSDDGFDTINSGEPAIIEHCWAFYNGYSSNSGDLNNLVSRADGNGFKIGGYGAGQTGYYTILQRYAPIPRNVIKFSIAAGNKVNGFYANHHLEGNYWYNNSAYYNKNNYNMLNSESLTSSGISNDVPGWNHVLANNVGFGARSNELTNISIQDCTLSTNSFDPIPLVSVSADDFMSLDVNLLMSPRQADGSLPDINFMKLKADSDLIDAGSDIGLPFDGNAPDIGHSEHLSLLSVSEVRSFKPLEITIYPNPFKAKMSIEFELNHPKKIEASIYDINGKKVYSHPEQSFFTGKNCMTIKRNNLPSGNYFFILKAEDNTNSIKLIAID